jgi:hypothetical protein
MSATPNCYPISPLLLHFVLRVKLPWKLITAQTVELMDAV